MSQTIIQISSHTAETNQGRVTSYLPLPSYAAIEQCSAEIYSDVLFVAFNPFYGQSILTSITCLPQAVTLWWEQTSPQTTTEIGPIVCPDLYTTASTSIVNSLTTFVACCPKSYTFNKLVPVSNVGECNSPLSQGQSVNFVTFVSNSWIPGSTTITAPGSSVSGVHINGYVFAATTTAAPAQNIPASQPTFSNTPVSTASIPTSTSPATIQSSPSESENGLTTGTKIGIGIGVPLAALGICSLIFAFLLLRRSKKAKWKIDPGQGMESNVLKSELAGNAVSEMSDRGDRGFSERGFKYEGMREGERGGRYNLQPYEMESSRHNELHEMGASRW